MIDEDLLPILLCSAGELHWTSEDIPDDVIERMLRGWQMAQAPAQSGSYWTYFDSLRMNKSIQDARARVLDYGRQLVKIVKDRDLGEIFSGEKGPKKLKTRMKELLETTEKHLKSDPDAFFKRLEEKAIAFDEVRRAQSMSRLDGASRQTAIAPRSALTIPKKRKEKEQPMPAEEQALKKLKRGKEEGEVPQCWFCKGEHRLRQCPKASDDQKERIVKKLREAREAIKEARINSSSNAIKPQGSGYMRVSKVDIRLESSAERHGDNQIVLSAR
ncbi:hypothetical protein PBRA_009649 [Plasmodiophora brassicae]|uniref:CCHC-type domain-containing protein n=1 Tax=Plasmodiophora brassicae TaxID=37360 RepID=A0A0G4IJJ9_PLABS|nr:hypothetical protein PBRA_009649 [Plasmodiophora brassicae]